MYFEIKPKILSVKITRTTDETPVVTYKNLSPQYIAVKDEDVAVIENDKVIEYTEHNIVLVISTLRSKEELGYISDFGVFNDEQTDLIQIVDQLLTQKNKVDHLALEIVEEINMDDCHTVYTETVVGGKTLVTKLSEEFTRMAELLK